MQLVERQLSYKAKLDKMYKNQFYLTPSLRREFLAQLEDMTILGNRSAGRVHRQPWRVDGWLGTGFIHSNGWMAPVTYQGHAQNIDGREDT